MRVRFLGFRVAAGVESRTNPRAGVPVLDGPGFEAHMRGAISSSDALSEDIASVLGEGSRLWMNAQVWVLTARGHLDGPGSVRAAFAALHGSMATAFGRDSEAALQCAQAAAAVERGVMSGKWWPP